MNGSKLSSKPVPYSAALAALTIIAICCPALAVDPPSPAAGAHTERTTAMSVQEDRTLSFSGYQWFVKGAASPVGPGPNYFGDGPDNVWVDADGSLHLRIAQKDGRWYCAEVGSKDSFGYGTYIFHLAPGADRIDPNAVLGLFTWETIPQHNNREIDIEISRWSQPDIDNCQFVIQPYERRENIHRFELALAGQPSTHSFEWRPQSVSFQSRLGDSEGAPLDSWTYTGPDLPAPGKENARINLWLFNGAPPSDGEAVEVVVTKFLHLP